MAAPGPIPITALNGPWPLQHAQAARQVEQAALARQAPRALMAAAGLAVARLAQALVPQADGVHVWAGPGNNGGDGLVAARHLHQAGHRVTVSLLGDRNRLPADAAWALQTALQAGLVIGDSASAPPAGLLIDALLGLGSTRAPAGALAQAIASINAAGVPVLAVDLPSGLNPDTGALLGMQAVQATATLSLLSLKPGCLTGHGRACTGDLWLDTLGVDAGPPTAWLGGPPPRTRRSHASHKGSFGDVAVVGGAPGMAGAAWLSARAALAAGAGRVYCSLLGAAEPGFDPGRPEIMGRVDWWRSPPAALAATTVACGCGGGQDVHEALPPLLSQAARLVLDADALNAIAQDEALRPLLHARTARGLATLLTPHPLEAARLLRTSAGQVQQDRLAAAQSLAESCRATVLLKGSGSVIATPGRLPLINPSGNAALATAGTGDVLAGWAAGLWAQQPESAAHDVAAMAAWQHGHAADRHARAHPDTPLRAADLVETLLAGGRTA